MELVFERRGVGEPLVLLHGIGSRWQVFEPVLDLLTSEFEVWAVDMPGFGASPPATRPLSSIGTLTDEVQAWMRTKGLEGCHVAAAHPARISPAEALADADAIIGAASFDDLCAAFTGYLSPTNAADRVPVTIAWGNKDRLLLPRQLERARRRLPRARHVLIMGVGHLMMGDDPHAVADVVRSGVREPAPAGAAERL